jgi:hypothetical protein
MSWNEEAGRDVGTAGLLPALRAGFGASWKVAPPTQPTIGLGVREASAWGRRRLKL